MFVVGASSATDGVDLVEEDGAWGVEASLVVTVVVVVKMAVVVAWGKEGGMMMMMGGCSRGNADRCKMHVCTCLPTHHFKQQSHQLFTFAMIFGG